MSRSTKPAKPYIVVFCEGESEQAYTDFLRKEFKDVASIHRKRQTTPRMDRHETIVTGRCETFRYYCIVGVSG